jgi:hypothetical protein
LIRSSRDFWTFHVIFWAVAGLALFAYGLTYGHVRVAFIRNLYSPVVGFACSYLIRSVFESRLPATTTGRLSLVIGLSLLGALVSALVVNPITYALLGYDIGELHPASLLQDGLYFVLLYLLWSVLYLQLTGKPLVPAEGPATSRIESINVTKGSRTFRLDPANVTCIKASGDYVELCTSEDSYLKHGTISSYERALAEGPFVRIHRSILVNRDKVASVTGPSKGQYWVLMDDGRELRSSRKYREAVQALVPEAR